VDAVASPREAAILYPDYYGPYNRGIQEKIDRAIYGGTYAFNDRVVPNPGLLALLGLDASAVVELPVLYSGDGIANWSSPVSSVYLNGVLLAGDASVWAPERAVTEDRLKELGIGVVWLDTEVYYQNLANLHSAINTTRTPLHKNFADHLPADL
jgi:hypothetical protein